MLDLPLVNSLVSTLDGKESQNTSLIELELAKAVIGSPFYPFYALPCCLNPVSVASHPVLEGQNTFGSAQVSARLNAPTDDDPSHRVLLDRMEDIRIKLVSLRQSFNEGKDSDADPADPNHTGAVKPTWIVHSNM